MKILLILLMGSVYSGELEVEGNLSVTEGVTATSFVGDGSGLTNLPSLGGMHPERIYTFHIINSSFSYTVPSNKVWCVIFPYQYGNMDNFKIDNITTASMVGGVIWLLQNQIISADYGHYLGTIYEYSITGSGSEQGMNYVIP